MREHLTAVTRRGQITLPAGVRRALGLQQGDKVAVTLDGPDNRQAVVRPVRSVTELTFGAVAPRKRRGEMTEQRRSFMDTAAENAASEGIDGVTAS